MHEHVGDDLPYMEVRSRKIMQAKNGVQIKLASQNYLSQKEQAIDYQQVFNNRRQDIEASGPNFIAHIFVCDLNMQKYEKILANWLIS